jgi:hypothetical protein
MWLAHGNRSTSDTCDKECGRRYALSRLLEIRYVSCAHDVRHSRVKRDIVDHVRRSHRLFNSHREIDFYRLWQLGFVRQYPDASVKSHPLE